MAEPIYSNLLDCKFIKNEFDHKHFSGHFKKHKKTFLGPVTAEVFP